MTTVIIGGVAAGMSVAAKLKREKKDEVVIVLEKSGIISYGACGLPYYVSRENPDLTLMHIRSVQQMQAAGIDVRLFHEVTRLEPNTKSLYGVNNEGEFHIHYDRCVIASGASPILPQFTARNKHRIFTLKTLEDGEKLKHAFASSHKVGILGAGFIGCELVDAAVLNGKQVVLIEKATRILSAFDPQFSVLAHAELIKHGVKVVCNEAVVDIVDHNDGLKIISTTQTVAVDCVVVSLGVNPNTAFCVGSGIALAPNGAIYVDNKMQTNIKDVYAAGDCSMVTHFVTQNHHYLPLGTNANKQGRNLGQILAGQAGEYTFALGSVMVRCCQLELAKTGLSELEAKAANIDVVTTMVTTRDVPLYFPNGTDIHIKLVADAKSGVLLGAQLAGAKNVALRSHALSVAISARLSAMTYANLDLGYAPPFATTYDATQVAAQTIKIKG